jgi:hypothetical protein
LRPREMRKIAALILAGVFAGACGSPSSGLNVGGASPDESVNSGRERSVEIYAAVIRQLVTEDHTFGDSPSPFEHVYVVDGAVDDAADPMRRESAPEEPFNREVKEGLKEELNDLPPVDFVSDPDSVRDGKSGIKGVKNDGVIITLGAIAGDGEEVEVGNSLWCSIGCGQWLTYVVELQDGQWEVTGTTGPSSIS